MLHIENIDAYSIKFGDAYGGGTYFKVFAKTLEASKDEIDRIYIYDINKEIEVLGLYEVANITLDGTVHSTASEFVIAFNALMDSETVYTTTTTTAAITTTTTTV